jgi:PAS domain S-box-containing protein
LQSFQFTPYSYPLVIAALFTALLTFLPWDRRDNPGAKPAAGFLVSLFIWIAGYSLEVMGTDLATKLFWAKIQYFGIVALPVALLLFALVFSGRRTWITTPKLFLLVILPVITLLLVLSNELHNLIWSDWKIESIGTFSALNLDYGLAFWAHIVYSLILLAASTILIVQKLSYNSKTDRSQTASIFLGIGIAAPWLGILISLSGLNPLPFDLMPFAFVITGFVIAWSVYEHRSHDITPLGFEAVIASMSDSVFILDMRNNVVDVNPAGQKVLGFSSSEIVGRHVREVFKDQLDLVDLYENAMNIREEIAVESDSQKQYYELSISPLTDHLDKILGRAVILHDISDRKKAENAMITARDQALEASRVKSQFLARIGHELRTPLGVIRGYADLLTEPAYGALSEQQVKAVHEIIDSTQRVSDMVSELLDEARLSAGAVQLDVKPFTPALILKDVQEKLSVLAKQKGLALISEIDDGLPEQFLGDPIRINQMITNLTSNSIKFTEEGKVSVRFYRHSQRKWAMEVSDTGPGIPEDAQKDIFEPFRQADGSISKKYGGTGLGLSIVKHLTNLMEGEIIVRSKIGEGSTFMIVLPLNTADQD